MAERPDEELGTRCPDCKKGFLNYVSGDFGSGVFAPDGVEEKLWEEFLICDRCAHKFDVNEFEEMDA